MVTRQDLRLLGVENVPLEFPWRNTHGGAGG